MSEELVFNPHAVGPDALTHSLVPHEDPKVHQWYRKTLCGITGKALIMTTAAVDCPACLKAVKPQGGI